MKLHKFTTTDNILTAQNRTFRFTFSDSGVDRDGDRLYVNGWDVTEFEQNPIVLFSHDAEQPIGRAKNVHVEDGKLVGDIEIAETDLADTVYQLVDGGFLKAVSVGFMPLDYEFAKDRKGGIDYKKQRLLEVSIVSIPSNPRALIDQPPFGKILQQARNAGVSITPVMKWMANKLLDSTTFPTERLIYKDTINSMNESDPADGGFAVDDDDKRSCGREADEQCEYDDADECCVHRRDDEQDEDEDKAIMASTKAMKAAHDELLRLNRLIKELKATTSPLVITKADDDDDSADDPEYRSMGLKIAASYVKAARMFHSKAMECHDDACKTYAAFHKDDDPDADDDKDDDDVEEKDDEPDDDDEKRFAQIMARARAATR